MTTKALTKVSFVAKIMKSGRDNPIDWIPKQFHEDLKVLKNEN